MNAEEYAAAQAAISQAVMSYTRTFGKFFTRPALSIRDWLGLMQMLYPEIQRQREKSAALARDFYDAQRALYHPELPQHDRLLEGTDFPTFVKSMEPARARMSQVDSPEHAVTQLALQSVREVENAGRRQIIHSVEDDQAVADLQKAFLDRTRGARTETPSTPAREPAPEAPSPRLAPLQRVSEAPSTEPTPKAETGTKVVRGWARVATGRETCAWCLMLVSRGPVYLSADSAGLDLENGEAQQMIASGTDVREFMNQWHPGCDCIVVPVYKEEYWPGSAAQQRAEQLWIDATEEAKGLIDSGDARTDNLNKETLNALRRRLDRGEINSSEFAGLAA